MIVKRIVTNIHTEQIEKAKCFYQEVLGLNLLMDQGWIASADEPWGVRRFYVRDPFGNLVNILAQR
ncbi:hypothetical protein EHV15_01020 [Paenibacillus oralis]|uniref:Glyoxalase/Bleomycin resistance-like N-terminal domain-containing protein n=1 Tax=Paenibacillus oralis TaxID=2490856 RepID=A0A3P3UG24_9BACL|nr:hypothetical protein [Paenibacillus oralis]RRJ67333.1 hypothetical protein EHV15_01020 [Paenibacillus oralis]